MRRTTEQINRIVGEIEQVLEKADSHEHLGIRADDVVVKKQFRSSYNRPDGNRTTRLPGLCVVYVGYDDATTEMLRRAIIQAEKYGAILCLVEGESPNDLQYLANDPGERIFTTHKILWQENPN